MTINTVLPSSYKPRQSSAKPMDYLAFADDVILVAVDKVNHKSRIKHLATLLKQGGLTIKARKPTRVNIISDKCSKKAILGPSYIKQCEIENDSLKTTDIFKFHGIHFNWRGKVNTTGLSDFTRMLVKITTAPLKPRRVQILRNHLLPK